MDFTKQLQQYHAKSGQEINKESFLQTYNSGTINENPSGTFLKLSIRHTCIILVQTKIL